MCHHLLDIMSTFSTAFKEVSLVVLQHKHNYFNRWNKWLNILKSWVFITSASFCPCRMVTCLPPPSSISTLLPSSITHEPSALFFCQKDDFTLEYSVKGQTSLWLNLWACPISLHHTTWPCGNANLFRMAHLHHKCASPVLGRANHALPWARCSEWHHTWPGSHLLYGNTVLWCCEICNRGNSEHLLWHFFSFKHFIVRKDWWRWITP